MLGWRSVVQKSTYASSRASSPTDPRNKQTLNSRQGPETLRPTPSPKSCHGPRSRNHAGAGKPQNPKRWFLGSWVWLSGLRIFRLRGATVEGCNVLEVGVSGPGLWGVRVLGVWVLIVKFRGSDTFQAKKFESNRKLVESFE